MFFLPLHEQLSSEQLSAWNDIQIFALKMVRDSDPNDPWLFHGTNAIAVGWILRDGFYPQHLGCSVGRGFPSNNGVYWGHPAIAAYFAGKYVRPDNPPVLFAARASSVAESTPDGILRPDFFACEECGCPRIYPDGLDDDSPDVPKYDLGGASSLEGLQSTEDGGLEVVTWQQSLSYAGSVVAPVGRHVPDLVMLDISPELPLHPDAGPVRAERLARHPEKWERTMAAFVAPGMREYIDPRSVNGARPVLGVADIDFTRSIIADYR